MWADYNDKIIDNILIDVEKAETFPMYVKCVIIKPFICICTFTMMQQKEELCGSGVVPVIRFGIVLFMFHQVGRIAH